MPHYFGPIAREAMGMPKSWIWLSGQFKGKYNVYVGTNGADRFFLEYSEAGKGRRGIDIRFSEHSFGPLFKGQTLNDADQIMFCEIVRDAMEHASDQVEWFNVTVGETLLRILGGLTENVWFGPFTRGLEGFPDNANFVAVQIANVGIVYVGLNPDGYIIDIPSLAALGCRGVVISPTLGTVTGLISNDVLSVYMLGVVSMIMVVCLETAEPLAEWINAQNFGLCETALQQQIARMQPSE